jgi:hypothetical protein
VLVKQEEFFKIIHLNNENIRWHYAQGVKLYANRIIINETDVERERENLTKHTKFSSIHKFRNNKETKQNKKNLKCEMTKYNNRRKKT